MDNIAIIITKLNGGGAERCASNLSIELSKKYNVVLIVFDGNNITYPYKGNLIDLNLVDSNDTFHRTINVLKRVKAVKKIKKEYNISCSISLLDGPNLVNVMSRVSDKVIVSIRNRLSSEYVGKVRRKLIVYSSKKADLTVALSKMVEKDMNEEFGIQQKKLTTIYNHCDPELLHSLVIDAVKPDFICNDKVYFVTMGRLNIQKGQWHLIRTFKKVLVDIPNAVLIIMGTGELDIQLKKLVDQLGIEDHVIFTGYIENPHIVLQYSEIFVFPSLFEGLGNVLLEALAFNMPIISADCIAGPREILAPNSDLSIQLKDYEIAEFGILVPPMDKNNFDSQSDLTHEEQQLCSAMILLHIDENLRKKYSQFATKRVSDFTKNKIISEWERVIND